MANDKNTLDDMEMSGNYGALSGGFSLESILAEYKGSAFMDGDKKTPSDELQRKTDEILREILGSDAPSDAGGSGAEGVDGSLDSFFKSADFARMSRRRAGQQTAPPAEGSEPERAEKTVRTPLQPGRNVGTEPEPEPKRRPEARRKPEIHGRTGKRYSDERAEPAYETAPEIDLSVFDDPEKPEETRKSGIDDFLRSLGEDSFDTPVHLRAPERPAATPEPPADVEETVSAGERELRRDSRARRRGLFGRLEKPKAVGSEPEDEAFAPDVFDGEDEEEPEEYEEYYDIEPDPDFKKTASKYAKRVPALRFRIFGAALIVILMIINTWLYSAGKAMPLIGSGARGNTASLLIMELLVMAVGMEVLVRGFEDILRLSPGAESLVFVSCLLSVMDGFVMLISGNFSRGLPMAVVSAISLLAALSARKSMYMAYCDSLKGAVSASSYYGVAADSEDMEGRRILKKVDGEREGFYAKLTSPDVSEALYDDLAPLLVIVSFALAFAATVGKGNSGAFTHTFSILTAVSAAFPATVLFALPFKYAAAAVRKSGAALAGYAGARDIFETDGALITDLDIFPVGSVRLEGVKMFEGVDQQKAIASSSSLLISSDSGLRRVFEELLKSQNLTRRRVDDFSCYEGGGIGGLVDGERVLVGTGAFMNLMGLRVPDILNIAGNVFAAINDELVCVFTLSYVPSGSVQSALVALLGTRTNVLMAVRDFNVTPNTVKQRFKVSMDGVEYLPVETAYALSQDELPQGSGVSAVLCRGGLAPFAEVIARGRLLKLITGLNTMINGLGTAMSLLIMFFLCWSGAFASANALNITIFMSVIAIAVYIMSQGVRRRLK